MDVEFYWQSGPNERPLSEAFCHDLRAADKAQALAAWITESTFLSHLVDLANRQAEVVIYVGLDEFITTPTALDTLNEAGAEVWVWTTSINKQGLFHCKTCLIGAGENSVLWTGSMNLTRGGELANTECASRIRTPSEKIKNDFDGLIDHVKRESLRLNDDILDAYSTAFSRFRRRVSEADDTSIEKQKRALLADVAGKPGVIEAHLGEIAKWTWPEYASNLIAASKALTKSWALDQDLLTSTGPGYGYLHSIFRGRQALLETPVGDWTETDIHAVGGKDAHGLKFGMLGNLRNITQFKKFPPWDQLQRKCMQLVDAPDATLLSILQDIGELQHAGIPTASRVGALVRPDKVCPMTSRSLGEASQLSGLVSSDLQGMAGYTAFLKILWEAKWNRFSEVNGIDSELNKTLYENRCAFLDIILCHQGEAG